MCCKYIFFSLHFLLIFIALLGWQYWPILILQAFTILSWRYNQNRCILTQMENYLFGETLIDFYIKMSATTRDKKHTKTRHFVVPKMHRYLLYISSTMGVLCYIYNYK